MKYCLCNNAEHSDFNENCPHNQNMDFVLFTRAISEEFSLDGKSRWSDSDIINFMIEDTACNDMIMHLIATNFHKFCDFTLEEVADWESRVIFRVDSAARKKYKGE